MYTSVLLLALSGTVGVADDATPTWQNDYYAAQKQGGTQTKPLAVFLAPGENGYTKVIREGTLNKETQQLLAGKYIPVFVNTDTEAGRQLAREFAITGGRGIVISDRTGAMQAFWHQGDLSSQELVRRLQRYADPQLVVRTTETAGTTRLSYYDPTGQSGPQMRNMGEGPYYYGQPQTMRRGFQGRRVQYESYGQPRRGLFRFRG